MSHHMLYSLEGYLDNIAADATQTAENGGPLAELAASLVVSVDTVARQQIEIKRLTDQINALKKKGVAVTAGVLGRGGAAQVQACKTCHQLRVSTRCGAEISPAVR